MDTPPRAVALGMTPIRPRSWRRSQAVIAAAAVAVLAASCGSGHSSSKGHPDSSTTITAPTTSATNSAVLTAYHAEQAAFEQAFLTADAYLPALQKTMADPQLQLVQRNLLGEKHDGMIGKGDVVLHPHVASSSGSQAVVEDCLYSTQELVYAATGKPVPPITPPEYDGVRSTLIEVSAGTWKVSQQTVTQGRCPPGY